MAIANNAQYHQVNLSTVIQENEGKAKLANAKQTADVTTTLATADATAVKTKADGDAHQTRVTGDAEAGKLKAIGLANGDAIKAQVEAYGDPKLRMLEKCHEQAISGNRSWPDSDCSPRPYPGRHGWRCRGNNA